MNGLQPAEPSPSQLVPGVQGLSISKPKPPPGDPPKPAPQRLVSHSGAGAAVLPSPIVLRPPAETTGAPPLVLAAKSRPTGVPGVRPSALPRIAPPTAHRPVVPPLAEKPHRGLQTPLSHAVPKPAPPSGPKPRPPAGPPPPALQSLQNGTKPHGSTALQKPRPPPGPPPPAVQSRERPAGAATRQPELLPPELSLKLAAYRKRFLKQRKQLEAADKAKGAKKPGSEADKTPVQVEDAAANRNKASLALSDSTALWGSGVPGLDVDTPRALHARSAAKKRLRQVDEEIISLEDELELYSFGPDQASLAAASKGEAPASSALSLVGHETWPCAHDA